MGWGKSIRKAFSKIGDVLETTYKPITGLYKSAMPEKGKEILGQTYGAVGINMPGVASGMKGPAGEVLDDIAPPMSLGEDESQDLAAKRLARIGKYFTSPTGVLGNANTAASKIFS